jgi:hypothetical protein
VAQRSFRTVRGENVKKSGASQGRSASDLISQRIAELEDWRGETLAGVRRLITEADPDVVELESRREHQTRHRHP